MGQGRMVIHAHVQLRNGTDADSADDGYGHDDGGGDGDDDGDDDDDYDADDDDADDGDDEGDGAFVEAVRRHCRRPPPRGDGATHNEGVFAFPTRMPFRWA